jgi:hypothetical protein
VVLGLSSPLVTLSPEELFAILPDVQNRLHEAITLKQVPNEPISTHAFIEEIPDEETSITVPDIYKTYLNNLAPREKAVPLNVTEEAFSLQLIMLSINNKEEIEGIIDPQSQIVVMSEDMCHDINLHYNPTIKLNMQSANGDIDQSLSLVQNVPCRIGTIMLYLQIHMI